MEAHRLGCQSSKTLCFSGLLVFESAPDLEKHNGAQLATSVQKVANVRVKEEWNMLSIFYI